MLVFRLIGIHLWQVEAVSPVVDTLCLFDLVRTKLAVECLYSWDEFGRLPKGVLVLVYTQNQIIRQVKYATVEKLILHTSEKPGCRLKISFQDNFGGISLIQDPYKLGTCCL